MAYQFDFLPVLQNTDLLLRGALFTLELTAIGTLFGVSLGIVGAVVRAWNIRPFAALFGLYVEVIRNTPFLVQLFFIFFGLPGLGVHISEWQASALAMVINLGAYSTEIIRAGIQAIPKGQLEAAADKRNKRQGDCPLQTRQQVTHDVPEREIHQRLLLR